LELEMDKIRLKKLAGLITESNKKPLDEGLISSLFNKVAKNLVNKIESTKFNKETLIGLMDTMLKKMRKELEKQNTSADTKSSTSDILDQVEKDTRAKIESGQLTTFNEIEKYALMQLMNYTK
jgi:hypothetical protein